jgi:hypothetical protein
MTDNRWPSGRHEVILAIDGKPVTCRLDWFPDAGKSFSDPVTARCVPSSAEVNITVEQVRSCERYEDHRGVSVTQCRDLPGEFIERIRISGTPSQVRIVQRLGSAAIGERVIEPLYKTVQPNGPDCEPACRQAVLEWRIPYPPTGASE